jgi:hypothetical protein
MSLVLVVFAEVLVGNKLNVWKIDYTKIYHTIKAYFFTFIVSFYLGIPTNKTLKITR